MDWSACGRARQSGSPTLRDAITTTFDAKDLKAGTAWIGRGPDFFFAIESSAKPVLFIDDAPGPQMQQLASSNLWCAVGRIEQLGKLHSFHYVVDGRNSAAASTSPPSRPILTSNPAFRPRQLSDKIVHTSKIYDGMKSEYWIYVPAQYDPKSPAALMVFQDGQRYLTATATTQP